MGASGQEMPTEDLQWLKNMIDSCTADTGIKILRKWIVDYVNETNDVNVLRMARHMLQCGIDDELRKRN